MLVALMFLQGWTNQSCLRKARLRMKGDSLQGALVSNCKAEAVLALVCPEKLIADTMKIYGSGSPDLFLIKCLVLPFS